jgi:hypothetical protein
MTRDEIDQVLERHFAALQKRDLDGILATYADDAEHDAVGRDPNPIHGKAALGAFYRESLADLANTKVIPVRRLYGDEFAIDESILDGYAHGRPFDLEGYSRPVRFRSTSSPSSDSSLHRATSPAGPPHRIHRRRRYRGYFVFFGVGRPLKSKRTTCGS